MPIPALAFPYHKTRGGSEPGAWPTVSGNCQTPCRQEMKRRSLIYPLTLHPPFTLLDPGATFKNAPASLTPDWLEGPAT